MNYINKCDQLNEKHQWTTSLVIPYSGSALIPLERRKEIVANQNQNKEIFSFPLLLLDNWVTNRYEKGSDSLLCQNSEAIINVNPDTPKIFRHRHNTHVRAAKKHTTCHYQCSHKAGITCRRSEEASTKPDSSGFISRARSRCVLWR